MSNIPGRRDTAKRKLRIETHNSVNGLPFGATHADVFRHLGQADKIQHNYTGEVEMLYGDAVFRCFGSRLVECTYPDVGHIWINGVAVLSILAWLEAAPGSVEIARFRISLAHGIAYDRRDPRQGSITIFEKGRWDDLVMLGT